MLFGASYNKNCVVVTGEFNYFSMNGEDKAIFSQNDGEVVTESVVSVQAQCDKNFSYYELTFGGFSIDYNGNRVADAVVKCEKKGSVKFNTEFEYYSKVNCDDPQDFCFSRFGIRQDNCGRNCYINPNCNENENLYESENLYETKINQSNEDETKIVGRNKKVLSS